MLNKRKVELFFYNVVKPYSALLFLNNRFAGLFLIFITFINPNVALSGILAVGFTILFAEFIGFNEDYLLQGFYIYNSLLTGMGIGYIFELSPTSIALIIISSIFTFVLAFILNRLFGIYKIPILSLPFSIVTMFVYLASLKYSALLSTIINHATLFDISFPLEVSGYLKSLGSIFFLPQNIAGIFIALLILYFSRIIFIQTLVGYYFGVFIHSFFIGSLEEAYHDSFAFNYILVAVALCGVFLLPTIKNFFISLIGIMISVLLVDAINILFTYYSIPVFTMPFNITVISFIFILSVIYYKEFNIDIKPTPEESLSVYLSKIFRFSFDKKVSLPFSGNWSIYQAFDDEWTHKGEYKYAYDFVKKIENKSYQNDGLYLTDYYSFGESILSPINGYVIDIRADLPDNPIGEVDRVNNWGNYIIIKSDFGFFVEISHILQYSITVQVGEYIKEGTIIAKCGNSGYSPEPHIHIQVQETGLLGSPTKKFIFESYMKNNQLVFNNTPKKDEMIEAILVDKSLQSRFLFILDDIFKYEVYHDNTKIDEIEFIVKMNVNGEFYLTDKQNNKLFFYNDNKQFYFYNYIGRESYLKWLFLLAPKVPFLHKKSIEFYDFLPPYLVKSWFKTKVIEILSIFNKNLYKQRYKYILDISKISSSFGEIKFQANIKGFTKVIHNDIELRRIS